jgi:hypothetical protein
MLDGWMMNERIMGEWMKDREFRTTVLRKRLMDNIANHSYCIYY